MRPGIPQDARAGARARSLRSHAHLVALIRSDHLPKTLLRHLDLRRGTSVVPNLVCCIRLAPALGAIGGEAARVAAFVRRKKVGDYDYYQVVESRRVDGEPRQRVLLHLGHHETADAALEAWPEEIEGLRRLAREDRQRLETLSEQESSKALARNIRRRVAGAERRADRLEAHLKKLRELKDNGVV